MACGINDSFDYNEGENYYDLNLLDDYKNDHSSDNDDNEDSWKNILNDDEVYVSDDDDDDDYKSTSSSDDSSDEVMPIELPVAKHKDEIIEAVKENQVVIITGKTGCGKTTQVPQYLLDAGLNNKGIIGITQPRRICAVSIAKRISKERGCRLGREVGYQVRFDTRLSSHTKIKVMTEGILINDYRSDKKFRDYGVILIDEVHERSINGDILLGLMKNIVSKRSDLRIIICSATIDAGRLSHFFNGAKIVKIRGRPYPVDVIYSKDKIKNIVLSYICNNIDERMGQRGHVLIFFGGVSELLGFWNAMDKYIDENNIKDVFILPLYAGIGIDAQKKALKPVKPHQTKIVLSTNIAESSLTIEGVKIVIDTGDYTDRDYIPRPDIEIICDEDISKARAEQRRGRAGRTSPGICYRTYSHAHYISLNNECIPAILKENLNDMYIQMISLNLNPNCFDYFDPPYDYQLRYAERELKSYSLIDNELNLTSFGHLVSELPITVRLGKVIQISLEKDCFFTILCICSMLTDEYIFLRPWKNNNIKKSYVKRKKFYDKDGDLFTLLNLYKLWKLQENPKRWCHKYFVNLPIMKEIDMIVEQLYMILRRRGIMLNLTFVDDRDEIKKSFTSVFKKNIGWIHYGGIIEKIDHSMEFEISKYSHFRNWPLEKTCLFIKAMIVKGYPVVNNIISIGPDILESFEIYLCDSDFENSKLCVLFSPY